MIRRTVSLPDSVEQAIRDNIQEGESFSAAAARLILAGIAARGKKKPLRYVASGTGPRDLGLMAEKYLRDLVIMK
ncbi:MAG: hypothetical protein HY678_03995 [Chloroflexi bacterium]|nr:hypothetical protein [Chloroflexota bacterium]